MVTISSELVLKGLTYLKILNEGRVYPSKGHINAFVGTQVPTTIMGLALSGYTAAFTNHRVSEYLLATGMAEDETRSDELNLTTVGLAFLKGLEKLETGSGAARSVIQVVGRLEDPIVYSKLLTEIDKLASPMVVDPYLPPGDLLTLTELPNVERILTRDTRIRGQDQDERKRHLALALGAKPEIELRFLPSEVKELHDRYVLPVSGEGLMIGTSLGGTQLTVITHLSEDTTQILCSHYEDLWAQGTVLEPITRKASVPEQLPTDDSGEATSNDRQPAGGPAEARE